MSAQYEPPSEERLREMLRDPYCAVLSAASVLDNARRLAQVGDSAAVVGTLAGYLLRHAYRLSDAGARHEDIAKLIAAGMAQGGGVFRTPRTVAP